jgi:DNA-binding XRE family transcriptional regulator
LAQKDLGARIGITASTISSWERGKSRPNAILGMQLARALDTLLESLYWDFYSQHPDSKEDRKRWAEQWRTDSLARSRARRWRES